VLAQTGVQTDNPNFILGNIWGNKYGPREARADAGQDSGRGCARLER
jgi:hypothetical protein